MLITLCYIYTRQLFHDEIMDLKSHKPQKKVFIVCFCFLKKWSNNSVSTLNSFGAVLRTVNHQPQISREIIQKKETDISAEW